MKIKVDPAVGASRIQDLDTVILAHLEWSVPPANHVLANLIAKLIERGILPLHDLNDILETTNKIEPFPE